MPFAGAGSDANAQLPLALTAEVTAFSMAFCMSSFAFDTLPSTEDAVSYACACTNATAARYSP